MQGLGGLSLAVFSTYSHAIPASRCSPLLQKPSSPSPPPAPRAPPAPLAPPALPALPALPAPPLSHLTPAATPASPFPSSTSFPFTGATLPQKPRPVSIAIVPAALTAPKPEGIVVEKNGAAAPLGPNAPVPPFNTCWVSSKKYWCHGFPRSWCRCYSFTRKETAR